MSTESRNFAIVRRRTRPTFATPGSSNDLEELAMPNPRYALIAGAWNKAVDILLSPRGLRAVRAYCMLVLMRQGHIGLTIDSAIVKAQAKAFLDKLRDRSPLLVDDGTMESRRQVSEHPRGSWSGSYAEFDVRTQAIKINAHWVSVAEHALTEFLRDRESKARSAIFQLAYFKLVHAFSHEAGHLLQTFLGHGLEDTPPGLSGGASTRHPGTMGGEAGEVIEIALFGGLVDFFNDNYPLGAQSMGFPWAVPRSGDSWRIDLHSIGLLLQPDWVGDNDPVISQSQTWSEALRTDTNRPTIRDGQVVSSMRPASQSYGNMSTGFGHRRNGSDVSVDVLRRLSSPPVSLS